METNFQHLTFGFEPGAACTSSSCGLSHPVHLYKKNFWCTVFWQNTSIHILLHHLWIKTGYEFAKGSLLQIAHSETDSTEPSIPILAHSDAQPAIRVGQLSKVQVFFFGQKNWMTKNYAKQPAPCLRRYTGRRVWFTNFLISNWCHQPIKESASIVSRQHLVVDCCCFCTNFKLF